jgi:hypothetical protein
MFAATAPVLPTPRRSHQPAWSSGRVFQKHTILWRVAQAVLKEATGKRLQLFVQNHKNKLYIAYDY